MSIILKLLPTIIGAIATIISWARENQMLEAGQQKAISDALVAAQAAARQADAVRADTAKQHAADKTDGAFDKDFFRD